MQFHYKICLLSRNILEESLSAKVRLFLGKPIQNEPLVKPIEDPLKHFYRLHSMVSLKPLLKCTFSTSNQHSKSDQQLEKLNQSKHTRIQDWI